MSGYIDLQLFLLRILFGGTGAVVCGMGAFEFAGQLYSIPPNSRASRRPTSQFEFYRRGLQVMPI
jgi:hypothetical protein